MKNRLAFSVLILLSTLIFACKKFDQQPSSGNYYLRAEKNSVLWDATQGAYLVSSKNTTDTLIFFGSKGEEHLNIVTYQDNTNQLKLDSVKTRFYTTVGLDVVVSSYRLDTTAANKLSVNIVSLNQPAAGNFDLTFKKVSGDATFPATVVFSQGAFVLERAIVYTSKTL